MPEFQIQSAVWPGAVGVEQARYVCSHGITPGYGYVVVSAPPTDVAPAGDLVLTDGRRTVTVRDCLLVGVRYNQGESGQTWTLTVADRRWRWAFGSISGSYNETGRDNESVPWTVRSPEELAELCLEAMGEVDYDIDLPPGPNPPQAWSVETPAKVLARLAERYGRRVVFDPVEDRVLIAQPGDGDDLPDTYLESRGANVQVPKTPAGIGVVGAPVRFQTRLRLEAVGEEWDGTHVPIDELSYAPDPPYPGGRPWDAGDLGFSSVRPTNRLSFDRARELAGRSVWRVYRLADRTVDPGPWAGTADRDNTMVTVAGYPRRLDRREQIVPQSVKVEQVPPGEDPAPADGHRRDRAAAVIGSILSREHGSYWQPGGTGPNTTDGQPLQVGFTIDPARQLVSFDRPMYVLWKHIRYAPGPGGQPARPDVFVARPAPLVLETAVRVKDGTTGEPARYHRWRLFRPDGSLGPAEDNGADPADYPDDPLIAWHVHDDVAFNTIGRYVYAPNPAVTNPPPYAPLQPPDGSYTVLTAPADGWYGGLYKLTTIDLVDQADAESRADYYLGGHVLEYQLKGGLTNTYAGIWDIPLDGAVMQVEWSVGPGGPTTVASRNCETSVYVPPYPARRLKEDLAPDPYGPFQSRIESQLDDARRGPGGPT